VIPIAGQAMRNREEITGVWDRLVNQLLGKRSQLVETGMPGSGKSVLLDHLTGKGLDPAYQPPTTSAQVERDTLKRTGQRLALAVLPGQSTPSRLQGINDLFLDKRRVRGVLHVVSFGYTETRSEFAVEAMRDQDLESLREIRLAEELEDLRDTCQMIRSHWNRRHEPIWLIVAANKVDLYSDTPSLEAAHARYAEEGDSEFTAAIRELETRIGADNFGWHAMPVCSWPENFRWADETVESRLDISQRNELLSRLASSMSARSEGAKDA